MRVHLTMANKGKEVVVRADATIEIACRVVWVDVLPGLVQMSLAHLGE